MKRNIVICIVFLCMALAGRAQEPALHFSSNGEFKIVQFTDLHYKWGKKASNKAIECMEEVLDAEKPDFVMVTGDLVYSASVAKFYRYYLLVFRNVRFHLPLYLAITMNNLIVH